MVFIHFKSKLHVPGRTSHRPSLHPPYSQVENPNWSAAFRHSRQGIRGASDSLLPSAGHMERVVLWPTFKHF